MSSELLERITVEPSMPADACVIWLHGLGADGYDFADIVPSLGLPASHSVRFIFPHAKSQPVSLNAGMAMPAWFDIYALSLEAPIDVEGLARSQHDIEQLIHHEMQKGIMASRIVLVGFSQGGALALSTALQSTLRLAGVAGLSTFLPSPPAISLEKRQQDQSLSIFLAHGLMDPIVPYWMGKTMLETLQNAGFTPQWHTYPIAHTVSLQECQALGDWLRRVLSD